MKSVAIGIPTYHHPEAVSEILSQTAQFLYDMHIDVYYYDGSSDAKTKEVVENFRSKGFTNLYHLHFPEDDHRTEMIFSGHGMNRGYDYIWPFKDRCMFTQEVLAAVVEALEENPDILCLRRAVAYQGIQKCVYREPVEFYHLHGWVATSINTVIYKKASMIGSFQNWIYPSLFNPYYSHLFHTLARMDTMNICVLYGGQIITHNSDDVASAWENKIFQVWKDDWIKVNDLLPECYAPYKDHVIKTTASLPWLIGDVERLQEFHNMGLLTPETMPLVEPNWERVSYVPIEIVREIAAGVYDSAHDMRRIVTGSEFTDMTISIRGMILSGRMDIGQIPWEAFQNYIHNRLQLKKRMNGQEIAQILTAVRYLEVLSKEKPDLPSCPDDAVRAANILQMITVFLLFIDRSRTLNPISTTELRGLIVTICENVGSGLMTAGDIPWKAIQGYLHDLLQGLNVAERHMMPLIMGSLGDLEQLSSERLSPEQADQTDRLLNLLNIVTVLLLLMENG